MGKIIYFFILFSVLVHAEVYYAKVEPVNIYTISSEVNGKVLDVKEEWLGKKLSKTPFITIDDYLDTVNLSTTQNKIKILQKLILSSKEILENLKKSLVRKQENYDRIKDLKIKSKTQKDALYFDLIATQNQILATQKEIDNYYNQLNDLKVQQAQLQKNIKDKKVAYPTMVLYELMVKEGQYVTPATPLAKVADISEALLTIYVDATTLQNIKNKTVYLDGIATNYKVSRVVRIADSVNLSKYKVQILIKPPKIFSKLVKVELK